MARKRSTPKTPAKVPVPAPLPLPDDLPEGLAGMLDGAAALMAAIRTRRVVLQRSQVVVDPDGVTGRGPNTLGMEPPETEFDFDPKTRILRVSCHCRLAALRGTKASSKKDEGDIPLMVVEAAFLLEYEIDPDVVYAVTDAVLEVFCDAALTQAWPYWREFVRDTSTRVGLPVIDVPFDVKF